MRPARFLLNEVKSVKKETFYGILKLIKIDPIKVDVNHDNPGSNLPQMMLKPMFISTETLTNPTERSLFFDSITSSGSSFVFVKQKDLNLLTDVDPQFSQQYLLSDAQNANQRQTNTGDSLITTTLNNNHNNNNNSMVAFKNLPTMTLKSILENSSLSKDSSKNDTPPALPEKQGIQKNEEAFLEAVLFGDEEKVETFLFGNSNQKNGQEEKINKDYLNLHHPLHGGTPLHLAASNGHVNLVKLFLGSGADVNARAFNGSTPLHWAMKHDTMSESQAVVRMLLKHGADVQAATYTWKSTVHGTASGQTPAHWASDFGNHFLLDVRSCSFISRV